MLLRKLLLPAAMVFAVLGLPTPAQAAPIPVTLTVIGAQFYGGQPAFVAQTGVAGLTASGVTCTKLTTGATIAPTVSAGAYTILGSSCSGGTLSNSNYTVAGYTGSTFNNYKAPLTVKAADRTKVYGDANPSLGATITGFVNGQDSSVLTGAPALSTTATASSNVGSYPITAAVGTLAATGNNYSFAFSSGALSVTPKLVDVTVNGAQFYGGQPAFSGKTGVAGVTVTGVTCTGLLGGSTISSTLTVGTEYGVDPATCSGGVLSSSNYAIGSYQSSYFWVLKAALTVTASDATREYGDANPSLGYTITGYQNDDDASDISGTPALSTTATASSNVGSYPITPAAGTLTSTNYRFVYTPGALAVTPKKVTVAVAGAQNYGGAPAFSGKSGVAGVTVSGVTCTGLTGDVAIAPTLTVGTSYALDPATCSGAQLSSSNYEVAGYSSTSFWVLKAVLTVTGTDTSRSYGAANPTFGYTVTGYQNDDDASDISGTPALSTTATASSNVGSYPITPAVGTLTSTNYRFVFAPGTLSVTPKQVTVSVAGAQTYGGQPAFAGNSGVSGVTVSGVTCTALTDAAIAPTLAAGVGYAIDPASCSGGVLSNANYAIGGYKSQSFWVFKAVLTVTPSDTSRVYGFGNLPLAYTFSGFRNDDDSSDINGAPAVTTTAAVSSNVGTYPITATAGTLTAANYTFSYQPGTFTVTKQQLIVSADPATRAFGAEPPAYSATFTGFRNGQTAAVLSGAPAFSTTATVSSDAGSYPLTVAKGTLDAQNYSFAGFNPSTLTVTTGPATITTKKQASGVLSATITYGAANTPVVGATVNFTIGSSNTAACTAVTGADGKASCSVAGLVLTQIQLSGYTARFTGTSNLLAGSKYQGIL
ncbi:MULTISPECIES: MBG domain-containing protein [unclassified Nocardioides]|uniref:MBG domain-containing protein n=1 Tax=unclassified Nocardioides TaxID=2615069 RepID=UPI0006FAD9F5|nr:MULTISPECIES: MBG domain-containing protein [unclassified Nocardioides]KRA28117.1 hypothetical protein ASD81_23430 [Nocardioides sp. Root614]KRA86091.1 hypothetical protein ASD84_23670 [Nocardioides sp. Root682]